MSSRKDVICLNISQLKYILEIAECGSIHKAAKKLFVSQPNLSNALKSIEMEYQITIFRRSSKGITLTEDGELFIRNARPLIEHSDQFEHYLKTNLNKLPRKSFRFCMEYYLPVSDAWISFCKNESYHDVHMQFVHASYSHALNAVANEEMDTAIVSMGLNSLPSFKRYCEKHSLQYECMHISDGYYIQVGIHHPLASIDEISYEHLLDYTRIDLGIKDADMINVSYDLQNLYNLNIPSILVADYPMYLELLASTNCFSYGSDFYKEGNYYNKKYGIVSKKLSHDSCCFYLFSIYNKKSENIDMINDLNRCILAQIKKNMQSCPG